MHVKSDAGSATHFRYSDVDGQPVEQVDALPVRSSDVDRRMGKRRRGQIKLRQNGSGHGGHNHQHENNPSPTAVTQSSSPATENNSPSQVINPETQPLPTIVVPVTTSIATPRFFPSVAPSPLLPVSALSTPPSSILPPLITLPPIAGAAVASGGQDPKIAIILGTTLGFVGFIAIVLAGMWYWGRSSRLPKRTYTEDKTPVSSFNTFNTKSLPNPPSTVHSSRTSRTGSRHMRYPSDWTVTSIVPSSRTSRGSRHTKYPSDWTTITSPDTESRFRISVDSKTRLALERGHEVKQQIIRLQKEILQRRERALDLELGDPGTEELMAKLEWWMMAQDSDWAAGTADVPPPGYDRELDQRIGYAV